MIAALRVVGRALRLWYGEVFILILFNLAWLALQAPVITGPPATAAMYCIARRVAAGELISVRDGSDALRQMFWPGLKWGLMNLVMVAAVVGNFWFYQNAEGALWIVVRLIWGMVAVGWLAVNIFYWPFWLVQATPGIRPTLFNGLLILAKRPIFALIIVLLTLLIGVGGALLTLPLAAVSMAWIALIGVLAVEEEIARVRARTEVVESPL